ncbi:tyrosine-type recombinase/integrase [Acidihalobacter ferrooxydans]|uniref:Integrase n=1 Tax=Acidihalobacter ferrooxydans TaxID=1765967 RepID=A0A1P8UJ48_9GAMM|nr:site-specific integrase [Acidihalobacter ferrooxydans]APZ43843.1 hypothetical protein BW247_12700 [Acidihalobacter ferrooxydans]
MATEKRLSPLAIKNAKATTRDRWLNDGGGLFLHVRPSGSKAWRLRYTINGKRRVKNLGDAGVVSAREARDAAHKARKLVEQGLDPIEEEAAAREAERKELEQRRTFEDALNRWAELELSSRKDGGAESIRALRKDVLPVLGGRLLDEITRGDVLDALDGIKARGAAIMANRTFGDLRQFFNWCASREWVSDSPLRGVRKENIGGREKERDRILSAGELIELRDKLPGANLEPQTVAAVWIMLATLCRVGELIQARWEDIDLESGTWRIPATNAKNAREHVVFLSDLAMRQFAILRERTGCGEWVMLSPSKDGHIGMKTITKQIRDRMREEPLSNRTKAAGALILTGGAWTPHDLRRTGATLMGELGVLGEVIERCLNHVEPSKIRRTYQRHEYRAEKREAWMRLGDYLDDLLTGRSRKVVNIQRA